MLHFALDDEKFSVSSWRGGTTWRSGSDNSKIVQTMPLNNGKHIVDEIDGVRCTIVENDVNQQRLEFLKELLELNHYEVKTHLQEPSEGQNEPLFTIGVTDILFNPVVDVYKRRLRSKTGHHVTPAYWLQLSDKETEKEVNYWSFK